MQRRSVWISVGAALLTAAASTQAATYEPGFRWQRSADWVDGQQAGSSLGNAAPDSLGSAVWRYGVLEGGNLASDDPWYADEAQLMVWDDEWFGAGSGVWARDYFGPQANNDHANPPVNRWAAYHDVSASTHSVAYTSAIDWINPVGNGAIVNVTGQLVLGWNGWFPDNSPLAPLEGAIVQFDASTGGYATLWTGRFDNPAAGGPMAGPSGSVAVPVDLTGLRFDDGDFLRFTLRADTPESAHNLWMDLRDEVGIRLVSVVPEPPASALLLAGLAGLALAGRRLRQRQP